VGRRIKVSSKRLKLIQNISPTLRRLDPGCVAKALGAEFVDTGVPELLLPAYDVRRAKVDTTNGKQ
jgi:hypothetical protein